MPFHITASHIQIVLLEFSLVASFFYCLIHHWFVKVAVWEEGGKGSSQSLQFCWQDFGSGFAIASFLWLRDSTWLSHPALCLK